jgi:hypothetical protein
MKILAATILLISSAITIYIGRVSSANHAPFIRAIRERDGVPCDTVIDMGIYKSYFDTSLREPLLVVYGRRYLSGPYNGRTKWKSYPFSASDIDYKPFSKKYDKGHMANAEDFSSDEVKRKLTYQYINCVPQTRALNRGAYRVWENSIRGWYGSDSLLIICGNIFGAKKIGVHKIAVPDTCFKIVELANNDSILHVLIFANDNIRWNKGRWRQLDVGKDALTILEKRIGYRLPLNQ